MAGGRAGGGRVLGRSDQRAAYPADDPYTPADLTASLRSLMVRKMGIVRDKPRLLEAQHDVEFWCRYVLTREFETKAGWELQNLLTVARLMIWSALQRTESRGVHFRADFPKRDDANWVRRVVCPAQMTS